MFDLLEVTYRFFANSQSGTIIGDQTRFLLFERVKLFRPRVVLEV